MKTDLRTEDGVSGSISFTGWITSARLEAQKVSDAVRCHVCDLHLPALLSAFSRYRRLPCESSHAVSSTFMDALAHHHNQNVLRFGMLDLDMMTGGWVVVDNSELADGPTKRGHSAEDSLIKCWCCWDTTATRHESTPVNHAMHKRSLVLGCARPYSQRDSMP